MTALMIVALGLLEAPVEVPIGFVPDKRGPLPLSWLWDLRHHWWGGSS